MSVSMNTTELLKQWSGGEVRLAEPMSSHTTFRIGGPADYFVEPVSAKAASDTIIICRREKIPCCVIGRGSNLLVGDKGFRGVIIRLGEAMSECRIEGTRIYAEAGITLAALAANACTAGLDGLAFAAGIPGSLGGAVVMNAGAYGGEMKDIITSVQVLREDGVLEWKTPAQMAFGYRTSAVQKNGDIVLAAEMELTPGKTAEIRSLMAELAVRRKSKQPLEFPSAGSTFKRPEGHFAGKLIQDAGLAGFSVGDAAVSEKHCGFVINKGSATAADVVELCRIICDRVYAKSGVMLEPEIRLIGEFS